VDLLLKAMQDHRDILSMDDKSKVAPILVHCSAGLGRTGTLCALFNIVESLRYAHQNKKELLEVLKQSTYHKDKYNDIFNEPVRVSIFGCVRKLREQRMMMVKE
jgi:protein tyrosine phosphatase